MSADSDVFLELFGAARGRTREDLVSQVTSLQQELLRLHKILHEKELDEMNRER